MVNVDPKRSTAVPESKGWGDCGSEFSLRPQYGAVMIVDPEEEYYPEEVAKLAADVAKQVPADFRRLCTVLLSGLGPPEAAAALSGQPWQVLPHMVATTDGRSAIRGCHWPAPRAGATSGLFISKESGLLGFTSLRSSSIPCRPGPGAGSIRGVVQPGRAGQDALL